MNGVGPNSISSMPWVDGGFQYEPLQQVDDRDLLIRAFEENIRYDPLGSPPCPPGVTDAECDTLEALARWNLGYDGGRQYYRYIDHDVKNGLPYFYAVVAYEPLYSNGVAEGDRARGFSLREFRVRDAAVGGAGGRWFRRERTSTSCRIR